MCMCLYDTTVINVAIQLGILNAHCLKGTPTKSRHFYLLLRAQGGEQTQVAVLPPLYCFVASYHNVLLNTKLFNIAQQN
jgi:hypothetical protein